MAQLIDMHCHTGWGSGDSHTDPNVLIEQAKAYGLNGICITEHNQTWEQKRVERLADRHDFMVIGGMEVDTSDYGHVLVYGLRSPRRFQRFPTVDELRKLVTEAGGAMVLAHPFRKRIKPPDTNFASGRSLEMLEEALGLWVFDLVDAVEVQNGLAGGVERAFADAVAEGKDLPTTGGSDTHRHPEVGTTFTVFPDNVKTERDLIDAILEGRMHGGDWITEQLPDRRHETVLRLHQAGRNGGHPQ
ncbi:MAG: CehA/McbA family metallohydrolase [Dehalococcoidia bacterium]